MVQPKHERITRIQITLMLSHWLLADFGGGKPNGHGNEVSGLKAQAGRADAFSVSSEV